MEENPDNSVDGYIVRKFGVSPEVFLEAVKTSPSAIGYVYGAISEVCLKRLLEKQGYEVIRIKEKPSGGNNAKSAGARGDFYIRPAGSKEDRWFVVESKGLKSNSEFRGSKLDSKEKVFAFLKSRAFRKKEYKDGTYRKGLSRYEHARAGWEAKNPGMSFPEFRWDADHPGPDSFNLEGIWGNVNDLENWVKTFDKKAFMEASYRKVTGPIAILETHQPSKRVGPLSNISQAAPLVSDFNIMSVDLYLRTGKHEFVFMNANAISHSPTSPEHLYQNYTIDILVKGLKETPIISPPWYPAIGQCISMTHPSFRKIDKTQIDLRG